MTNPQMSSTLITEVYDELRRRAARLVNHQPGAIAPTSLVHEAFEKLYRCDPSRWQDSSHFKATAALAMQQVLLDRVKASGRQKRGGNWRRVTLSNVGAQHDIIDALALHHALAELERSRPRCAEVVRLRILGGMELHEVSSFMEISLSTVKRDWRTGKAFVLSAMSCTDGS